MLDGFVNVLKAPGMTSSNVVYDVRKLFSVKHAGHLGTLDPGAAGVLPIALGRAAKLFDLLVDKEKTYLFELAFGAATDTLDAYGAVTETEDCDISRAALESVLPDFLGDSFQRAPAYSACKVDGRKMYDLARAGEAVPERLRPVTISALRLVEQTGVNRFLLSMTCSRGTYVRVVAEDIGRKLAAPCYVSFLLREKSGPFATENAFSIAELTAMREAGTLESAILPCEAALTFLPEIRLPGDRRKPTLNALPTGGLSGRDGLYRVYCDGFLGVGRLEGRSLRLTIHLD